MSLPDIPIQYQVLLYRRKMHVSYQEAITMPVEAFKSDWVMLDLEAGGSIKES